MSVEVVCAHPPPSGVGVQCGSQVRERTTTEARWATMLRMQNIEREVPTTECHVPQSPDDYYTADAKSETKEQRR